MYWFKNIELKRLLITLIITFFMLIIICLSLDYYLVNKVENSIATNNLRIITVIIDKYPNAEEDVVNNIINMHSDNLDNAKHLLDKYGINDKTYISNLDYLYDLKYTITIISILFLSLSFIILIIIISLYLKRIFNKIENINSKTVDVLDKNYDINMDNNAEGDLSILNDNIYKITTSLKEQKEILKKDKLYLKDAISDISHQLKTPLTSLNILTDLLDKDISKEDRKVFVDKMHFSLDRIEWLISSLLKLSRLDSKTIKLDNNKINIKKLMQTCIKSLSLLTSSKDINIIMNGSSKLSYLGDFNWSKEAIINIVKNSIEHSKERGIIEISWMDNPLFTEIIIKDNGEGIPKKDLSYIFNRFYKASNSHKDSIGIGLALAKTIINNQNGDITVKSELNKYTMFTIKIYK